MPINLQAAEKTFRSRISLDDIQPTHLLAVKISTSHSLEVKTITINDTLDENGNSDTNGYKFEYYQVSAPAPHKQEGLAPPYSYRLTENTISATICHNEKIVRFGPINSIRVNPRKFGIGSALMGQVIDWLQSQQLGDYSVEPGTLAEVHTIEKTAQINRNRFYMSHGFELISKCGTLHGENVIEGKFTASSISALRSCYKKGIRLSAIPPSDAGKACCGSWIKNLFKKTDSHRQKNKI
ncbi:hypothetical protein D3C77_301110 [compost metagenome]